MPLNRSKMHAEGIADGFRQMTLAAESKAVRAPSRLMDEDRGLGFWNVVMSILGRPSYVS